MCAVCRESLIIDALHIHPGFPRTRNFGSCRGAPHSQTPPLLGYVQVASPKVPRDNARFERESGPAESVCLNSCRAILKRNATGARPFEKRVRRDRLGFARAAAPSRISRRRGKIADSNGNGCACVRLAALVECRDTALEELYVGEEETQRHARLPSAEKANTTNDTDG